MSLKDKSIVKIKDKSIVKIKDKSIVKIKDKSIVKIKDKSSVKIKRKTHRSKLKGSCLCCKKLRRLQRFPNSDTKRECIRQKVAILEVLIKFFLSVFWKQDFEYPIGTQCNRRFTSYVAWPIMPELPWFIWIDNAS